MRRGRRRRHHRKKSGKQCEKKRGTQGKKQSQTQGSGAAPCGVTDVTASTRDTVGRAMTAHIDSETPRGGGMSCGSGSVNVTAPGVQPLPGGASSVPGFVFRGHGHTGAPPSCLSLVTKRGSPKPSDARPASYHADSSEKSRGPKRTNLPQMIVSPIPTAPNADSTIPAVRRTTAPDPRPGHQGPVHGPDSTTGRRAVSRPTPAPGKDPS